jgi:virulence-associated protein VapD
MADYVIAFDISTKKMKEDGQQTLITKVYNGLGKLLRSCGFTEKIQHSTYKTNNNNGINSLIELLGKIDKLKVSEDVPLFCQYAERVDFFRCEEHSDITERFRANDLDDIFL